MKTTSRTAMLIDDERADNYIHRRVLERSGLVDEVVVFDMAADALAALKNHEFEPGYIFLDINMPATNGWEFLDAFAALGLTDAPPVVVMLSTSLNPVDHQRAESHDLVLRFVEKPLTVELVRELFGERPAG